VIALVGAGSASAWAQALPNLNSMRVRYNTLKGTTKPEGELKSQIDQIDKELADAMRLGRTGEVRRLFAKGVALLNGRAWTDADEFQSSLVLRTTAVVVDSSQPQTIRLEQIFAPATALSQPLTAIASIRPELAPAAGTGAAPPAAPSTEVGRFADVARDLRESPLAMDLNLARIADGPHVLDVEVKDGERSLGTVSLRLSIQKGVDARLRQLEAATVGASPDIRADLRYPADYIRKINRGVVALGQFDVASELATAEAVAATANSGKNPFTGRTGGFERHYVLEAADEIMPYRVYVPTGYDGTRAYPLIVALHGLGASEDSFMDGYSKSVPTLAEQRGYIVVAPLGFRVDGFYGFSLSTDASPADRRRVELSEQDVMEVLQRARTDYKIDDSRIYLMGHSMGAIGTWAIAAKYPAVWAALAPFSGLGSPESIEKFRHIPQIVVHGDADPTVNVSGSRNMVEAMKKLGVDHLYIEVPGGNHLNMVVPNIPKVFDFFDSKRKTASPTTQQQ
ncbi:MAG: alpha/beta hydrolase-fold protein, partial [Vicinamibacterales bacterium]